MKITLMLLKKKKSNQISVLCSISMDRMFCRTDIEVKQRNLLRMVPWCPKKEIRSFHLSPVLANLKKENPLPEVKMLVKCRLSAKRKKLGAE